MSNHEQEEIADTSKIDNEASADGECAATEEEILISCYCALSDATALIESDITHEKNMLGAYIVNSYKFGDWSLPPTYFMLVDMREETENAETKQLLQRMSSMILAGNDPSSDDIIAFFVDSKFSFDTIFVLGEDGKEEYLLADRNILVQQCEFFQNMLGDGSAWGEHRNGKKPFVVRMQTGNRDLFFYVLQYLYTNRFHEVKKSDLVQLLLLADELLLEELQDLVFAAILDHLLTEETAIEIIKTVIDRCKHLVDQISMVYLSSFVLRPSILGFEPDIAPDAFSKASLNGLMQLEQDHLISILQNSRYMDISEETLLQAVVEWALRRLEIPSCTIPQLRDLTDDQETAVRELLTPILMHFDYQKAKSFINIIYGLELKDSPVHAKWATQNLVKGMELNEDNLPLFIDCINDACNRACTFMFKVKLPGFNAENRLAFDDTAIILDDTVEEELFFGGINWSFNIRQTPVGWCVDFGFDDVEDVDKSLLPIYWEVAVRLVDVRAPWTTTQHLSIAEVYKDGNEQSIYNILVDSNSVESRFVSDVGEVTIMIAFEDFIFQYEEEDYDDNEEHEQEVQEDSQDQE